MRMHGRDMVRGCRDRGLTRDVVALKTVSVDLALILALMLALMLALALVVSMIAIMTPVLAINTRAAHLKPEGVHLTLIPTLTLTLTLTLSESA